MHTNATKNFWKLCEELAASDEVAKLAKEAVEEAAKFLSLPVLGLVNGAVIPPSFLKAALEKAGFKVTETPQNVLHKVEVSVPAEPSDGETASPGPRVIAMGMSKDTGDALMQAVYAYLREKKGSSDL